MFPQILKQFFWDCYDHLGRLIAANLIHFFILTSAFFLTTMFVNVFTEGMASQAQFFVLLLTIIILPPVLFTIWFAAYSRFADLVSEEKDPPFREFIRSLATKGLRFWCYFQLNFLIIGVLLANIWFYTVSGLFPEDYKIVGYVLAGICFWICLLLMILMIPGIPVLGRQDKTIWQTFKVSFFALLRYPGLVIGMFVFLISLWVLLIYLRLVGLVIFGFAGPAMLLNSLYDVIIDTEEQAEKKAAEPAEKQGPSSWKEVKEQEKEDDDVRIEKARYARTFRDILKPWEG